MLCSRLLLCCAVDASAEPQHSVETVYITHEEGGKGLQHSSNHTTTHLQMSVAAAAACHKHTTRMLLRHPHAPPATLNATLAGADHIERLLSLGASRAEATRDLLGRAVRLAMTPLLNQMSVVGLVSIPGMMTGQILGGSHPDQAARCVGVLGCEYVGLQAT